MSAWERYQSRAAARPTDLHSRRLEDMRQSAQTNVDMQTHVLEMLIDHANMIDAIKFRVKEMQGFMDWAMTTHPTIFAEYKAVGELVEASGGGKGSFDEMLKEWVNT